MKRFLVFFGPSYYPNGGMEDFVGSFDELVEADNALFAKAKEDSYEDDEKKIWKYHWGHIYDTKQQKIIFKK